MIRALRACLIILAGALICLILAFAQAPAATPDTGEAVQLDDCGTIPRHRTVNGETCQLIEMPDVFVRIPIRFYPELYAFFVQRRDGDPALGITALPLMENVQQTLAERDRLEATITVPFSDCPEPAAMQAGHACLGLPIPNGTAGAGRIAYFLRVPLHLEGAIGNVYLAQVTTVSLHELIVVLRKERDRLEAMEASTGNQTDPAQE